MMLVGVAGLGRMGTRMARNLVRAGHAVTVWNRSPGTARAFADETGAAVAATPRQLAERTEIVVTMLADDRASEAVHGGPDGLFAAGTGARVFVEMGTMSPDHIAALVATAPAGTWVIDAPVSGATRAAEEAQLMVMAGCSDAEAAPLTGLFKAMARDVVCLGRPGAGAVMKLAVNMLIHSLNQAVSEALTLAEAAGIAPARAYDAIEASAAAAPMLHYRRALYLDEAAHPVSFTLALARKDMAVTAALAQRMGLALPQAAINLAALQAAEAQGYGDRDMAALWHFVNGGGE